MWCFKAGPVTTERLYLSTPWRKPAWGYENAAGPYLPLYRSEIAWEIDHVVPLWSVDRTLPWERLIQFWRLGNLSALCKACHRAKTAREAQQRAALRRSAKQPALL